MKYSHALFLRKCVHVLIIEMIYSSSSRFLISQNGGVTVAFLLLVIFSCKPNAEKYFRENHFFLKNDFVENILRRKPFYVETNGV
jgi:hypothetical protein